MKFTDGFQRKVFVGNGNYSQIVHVVILCLQRFFRRIRRLSQESQWRAEIYQLSRTEFFLLVVLVELVLVLFTETLGFILFKPTGSKRFHRLQLCYVFQLNAAL